MALQNTQRIQIELDGNPPFEYVVVKQGEKDSRIIEVTLLENKAEFEIPSGTTAKIKYYKPDGKKVLNPCTISGNVIKVEYSEQMLAAAGTGRGEIVLYNGDNVLRSATYYTKITETVYKENGLISDNEFLDMAESIIQVNQATDKALNAGASAEEAADAANTAAKAANSAASSANSKASAANNAASAANKAADAANSAAKSVDDAKTAATKAAQAANAAAETASSKAGAANSAATAANNAAQEANSKASEANSAATAANEAAEAAETATTGAQAATSSANTKAAEASTAAQRAEAAAAACENIADGMNSMADDTTGITYTIGISGGMIYLESEDE